MNSCCLLPARSIWASCALTVATLAIASGANAQSSADRHITSDSSRSAAHHRLAVTIGITRAHGDGFIARDGYTLQGV
jgi:hypothetical protein